MKIYDCVIIGAGPAGLSAAIYLARFNRRVIVIGRDHGRTNNYEINENYLGFPHGIAARHLTELGREQAIRFGAEYAHDSIESIQKSASTFTVMGDRESHHSRTVILATGVSDLFPNLTDYQEYLGKTLFWCITCDGYKTKGKKVVVIGDSNDAACTAMQFLEFTPQVSLVTNFQPRAAELDQHWLARLHTAKIPVIESEIVSLHGREGILDSIELTSGKMLEAEFIINQQGAVPNTALATQLGVKVNQDGYIETDEEQRTNIPKIYAAGDVTRAFAHQIITAAHEGSMAAQAANYDLYRPEQRF